MKYIIFLFCLIQLTFSQSQTRKVLFLGNSYTSVNNLPQMIADVAASTGDELIFDSNSPGGYYLGNHLTNTTSINKINQGNWDYIVLQDQSMSYAYSATFMSMFESAQELDSLFKANNTCGQSIFYITWGRKNGDTYLCTPPECEVETWINRTYYEMDSTIQSNYMSTIDSLQAIASPVGAVWRFIRQNYPSIELFNADESHPSQAGTYAAACCFYAAIFRKDPTLISFNSGLSSSDAINIRNAAKEIVYNHILNWHIGEYDSQLDVDCSVNGLSDKNQDLQWSIFPNPVTSTFEIKLNEEYYGKQIQIYNSIGVLLKEIIVSKSNQIDISELSHGIYFISLNDSQFNRLNFIKQ